MIANTAEGLESSLTTEQNSTEVIEALVETVQHQQEQIDRLEETVEELRDAVEQDDRAVEQDDRADDQDDHADDQDDRAEERERSARERAKLRQRVTDVEERLDDVEETRSADTEGKGCDDTRQSLTPIEQISDGDSDDVARHVTPSIERAVTLFERITDWGKRTPKGYTLRPAENPKKLLEAERDESLAWQQYYRAAEALESLSKGAVTFFDHDRHGKTVVLHEGTEVYDRLTGQRGRSQPSLVAD